MEIRYRNKKIRELCEKRRVAEKKLGTDCARKLLLRLQQLEAAARVADLVSGNPHPLKGEWDGHMALALAGGYRLVFAPADDPRPTNVDGSIAWSEVTIVSIQYIGDYHG